MIIVLNSNRNKRIVMNNTIRDNNAPNVKLFINPIIVLSLITGFVLKKTKYNK